MRPFIVPPLSSGDGVPAVPLQQPQALHPDPGRQRPGEDQVGGPPQRAPPHPEEEQAQGALRLRPQGGLRQHPAPHQDDTVCCYHRWALNPQQVLKWRPTNSLCCRLSRVQSCFRNAPFNHHSCYLLSDKHPPSSLSSVLTAKKAAESFQ